MLDFCRIVIRWPCVPQQCVFARFRQRKVRFVEKGQRRTHGAENSVGGASRFDADAHAPRRQVFAHEDAEQEERLRAQETNSLRVAIRLPETRRANPCRWCCRSRGNMRCCSPTGRSCKVWGAIHMASSKSDAAATVLYTVHDSTFPASEHSSKRQHQCLSLAARPKQARFLVASKESYSYFFFCDLHPSFVWTRSCIARTPFSTWTTRRLLSKIATTLRRTLKKTRLALFPSEPLPQVISPNSDPKSWLRRPSLTQSDSGLPEFILFWISMTEVAAMTVPGSESFDVAPRDRLRHSINTGI